MKVIIAMLCPICLITIGIGLRVYNHIDKGTFIIICVVAIIGGWVVANYDVIERMEGLGLKIQKKIEQTKEQAIADIKKEVAQQKESIVLLITNANDVNKKLRATMEMALPPTLSLISQKTDTDNSGYTTTLTFNPSKNRPLGTVRFMAKVMSNSDTKIISFKPTGGVFGQRRSPEITDNGKKADVEFGVSLPGPLSMKLKTSSICMVEIQGSHLAQAINVEIK